MKFLAKAAIVAAVLATSAAANADTFDFSYTFGDGQQVTGSLDGTLAGTTISNITNLQVSYGGADFTGPLTIAGYDAANGEFDAPAVVSTVASENSFAITDDAAFAGQNYFRFVNDPSLTDVFGGPSFADAVNFNISYANPDGSSYNPSSADLGATNINPNGTWTVAPVPVPAALPLLVSGLGLFGFARRRKLAK